MSDENELEPGAEGSEVNADAIVEAFSDDHHGDEEDTDMHFHASLSDEDEDEDFMDTNTEIMNHDKHW